VERVFRLYCKQTKTKVGNRDVILLPSVMDALKDQKQYSFVGGAFVFVRPQDHGSFIDYEHLERPWKHILKHAKVRYRKPYQTRHTYVNQLLGYVLRIQAYRGRHHLRRSSLY